MNIEEFAKQIGVSRTAVSYAIHGNGRLSPATRQMVLRKMEELGYRPNRIARALVTGRTHMVAFWTPDARNPFYVQLAYRTQEQLRKHRLDMFARELSLADTGERPASAGAPFWPVDGIIAADAAHWLPEYLKSAHDPKVPIVNMGVFYVEATDYVGINLYPSAVEAIRHLIGIGRRRVTYLNSELHAQLRDSRVEAYHTVMREAGLPTQFIMAKEPTRWSAREAVYEYARKNEAPEALFCHSDFLAMGAYRAVRDLGLRIPDDVAIVSCDGIEDVEFLETPLSTIVMPYEELTGLTCEFLHKRMEDPSLPPQQVVLQGKFVVRQSSGGESAVTRNPLY